MLCFNSKKWWQQKNPSYREACFRKAVKDTVELKGQYDYFIKITNENRNKKFNKTIF